jgi:protein-tyrosine kinase
MAEQMNMSNRIPHSVTGLYGEGPGRQTIGALLCNLGKLNPEEVDAILRCQRIRGLRFGAAGVELGFLSERDVQEALGRQYDYPTLRHDQVTAHPALAAAYLPFSEAAATVRRLRTELDLRWFAHPHNVRRCLAIVSPGAGEGRSSLVANLAVAFAQRGDRTLVIDADLRSPSQHNYFRLHNEGGLSAFLSGRDSREVVQPVIGFHSLSVLTAGVIPPNPQELLSRAAFGRLLEQMEKSFDVVLLDTPSCENEADAQIIASRAGGALLLARMGVTQADRLKKLAGLLKSAGTAVVGTTLKAF